MKHVLRAVLLIIIYGTHNILEHAMSNGIEKYVIPIVKINVHSKVKLKLDRIYLYILVLTIITAISNVEVVINNQISVLVTCNESGGVKRLALYSQNKGFV